MSWRAVESVRERIERKRRTTGDFILESSNQATRACQSGTVVDASVRTGAAHVTASVRELFLPFVPSRILGASVTSLPPLRNVDRRSDQLGGASGEYQSVLAIARPNSSQLIDLKFVAGSVYFDDLLRFPLAERLNSSA